MGSPPLWHSAAVSYALSFGPDFFRREYDDDTLGELLTRWPKSVEQAVAQLSAETWTRLAHEVFHCEPQFLTIDAVLQQIEATNTCLNLDPPVEVCVDPNRDFTVLVYDRDEDREGRT